MKGHTIMMNISIICPLYNAEKHIKNLDNSLHMQKNVEIESIKYILTESKDKTEIILNDLQVEFTKIKKEEFSHSLSREKVAMNTNAGIIVFISQDVIIRDQLWLFNLVRGIENGECEAAFSRQVCENNSIEKYIRENNYPSESRIVSKGDIDKLGLNTFFFSDASSAIRSDVFKELNGYDNKNLIINEDMYFAHKLITNGYRIKYCADSIVIHSHEFALKQLFIRYYDTGKFFAQNDYFNKYKVNKSGYELFKHVLRKSIKDKNYKVLSQILFNFGVRLIGMKIGNCR